MLGRRGGPRLVPYVEITVQRKNTKRQRSPTVNPVPRPSQPKRGRYDEQDSPAPGGEDDRHSPTVSEIAEVCRANREMSISPSVSEFVANELLTEGREESPFPPPPGSTTPAGLTELEIPSTYVSQEEEIEESGDLVVYGETPGESVSDNDSDDSDDDHIPVRRLDNFTIYERSTRKVVPAILLRDLSSRTNYRASGVVRPWIREEDEADEDSDSDSDSESAPDINSYSDWDRVNLKSILELSIHHVDEHSVLDSKIYIRTPHAWYILGQPSASYRPLFKQMWIEHRISHLLLRAAEDDPRLSYDAFQKSLPRLDDKEASIVNARDILGRGILPDDLNDFGVTTYLEAIGLDSELVDALGIRRSQLIRRFSAKLGRVFDGDSEDLDPDFILSKPSEKSSVARKSKAALKTAPIVITPIVGRISEGLFQVKMKKTSSGDDEMLLPPTWTGQKMARHLYNAEKVILGRKTGENEYFDIFIDAVCYKAGDVVMVVPDKDYKEPYDCIWTTSKYGDKYWFCQIQYFFVKPQTMGSSEFMFHGQWFLHSSRTVAVGELSHPNALYLIEDCISNSVNCIYQKCNFCYLQPGDSEPPEQPDSNEFFCSLVYDQEEGSLVDIPESCFEVLEPTCSRVCLGCQARNQKDGMENPAVSNNDDLCLQYGGFSYHLWDYVYLVPAGSSKLLQIAQIQSIKGNGSTTSVQVKHLERQNFYREKLDSKLFSQPFDSRCITDECQLVYTSEIENISLASLSGVCYVQYFSTKKEIDQWVQHNDHFVVLEKYSQGKLLSISQLDFICCEFCHDARVENLQEWDEFINLQHKLVGMELFSGAGGLGLGMELSGFVETKYAVEFQESAALTYQENNPQAKVYCQDSNLLLQQAVAQDNGEKPSLVMSMDGKTPCPRMPSRQDGIDFIFGGPPCQGFSRMNHDRQDNDIRTSMPCNMLSFAEHYEPSYFLLENVVGIFDFKLKDWRAGRNGEVIEWGMVKFINRTLEALGYQVRWKQMQAAQYGVPQSRGRVIFWAAKRGFKMPKFPPPTHAHQRGAQCPAFPGTNRKQRPLPPSRALIPTPDGKYHQCAPLPPLSIFDAISDLPAFDWKNPMKVYQPKHKVDNQLRRSFGKPIPVLDAVCGKGRRETEFVGYADGANYATPPMNRYQSSIRGNMKKGQLVTGQYTKCFTSITVEKTTSIPLKPGAKHTDLPMVLWPEMAKPGRKQEDKVFFGRLDGNEHFKCAMTNLAPNVKQVWPLHPLQRRIYSVRECARAQGFPDDYLFCSTNTEPSKVISDQIRQIGNAVAVPFARALGKELGAARISDWKKKQREGSPIL